MPSNWSIVDTSGTTRDLLDYYSVRVEREEGLGLPVYEHRLTSLALLPGASYEGYSVEPRVITLGIHFSGGGTVNGLHAARKLFTQAMIHDRANGSPPITFRYTGVTGQTLTFTAYYAGGLEGMSEPGSVFLDRADVKLLLTDPMLYEVTDETSALDPNDTVNVNRLLYRHINIAWGRMHVSGLGPDDGQVNAICRLPDGRIIVGGTFTSVAGFSSSRGIAILSENEGNWTSCGTGLANGAVNALVYNPIDKLVYVGGTGTGMGGVTGANYLASWNPTTLAWATVGGASKFNAQVRALCVDTLGTLYAGGDFTDVNAIGAADRLVKWIGGGFFPCDPGITNGSVLALAADRVGGVYVGGTFTGNGGVAGHDRLLYWPPWPYATGFRLLQNYPDPGQVDHITVSPTTGDVVIAGTFTSITFVNCLSIALYDGAKWHPMGEGATTVHAIAYLPDGTLLASGVFTNQPGVQASDRLMAWVGGISGFWAPYDLSYTAAVNITKIVTATPYVYLGFNSSFSNADIPGYAYPTPTSSARSRPVLTVTRTGGNSEQPISAKLILLFNQTTGSRIWFNYLIAANEVLTVNCREKTVSSNLFGDVTGRAVIGDLDFALAAAQQNLVRLFVRPAASGTITASLAWRITHWSADGAI